MEKTMSRFTAEQMQVLHNVSEQLDMRARNMVAMWNKQRQVTVGNLEVDWMMASAGLNVNGDSGSCFNGAMTLEQALWEVLGKQRFDDALTSTGDYKALEDKSGEPKPLGDNGKGGLKF
jgi:hypothetical protein